MTTSIVSYVVQQLNASMLVSPYVSNRVFANIGPQTPTAPYIVVAMIDGMPVNTLTGGSGLHRTRVQIDCYAVDYSTASGMGDAVSDCIDVEGDFAHRPLIAARREMFEPDVKLHRVSLDAILWHIPQAASP